MTGRSFRTNLDIMQGGMRAKTRVVEIMVQSESSVGEGIVVLVTPDKIARDGRDA
jgi:hypothetical protein